MNILRRVVGFLHSVPFRLRFRHALLVEGAGFRHRGRLTLNIRRRAKLTIGEGVFFNRNCTVNVRSEVTIGAGCLFGESVMVYDHDHRFRDKSVPIAKQGFRDGPVSIGRNVWVGSQVVILRGVTIGEGAVIGANVVINFDIPPFSVVRLKQDLIIEHY